MDTKTTRKVVGIIFFCTAILYFLPFVKMYNVSASIADLFKLGLDSGDVLDGLSHFVEVPTAKIRFYMIYVFIFMVLPIAEGLLILLPKKRGILFPLGIISVSVNTGLLIIMMIRIKSLLSGTNKILNYFNISQVEFSPVLLIGWILFYGAIVLFLIMNFVKEKAAITTQIPQVNYLEPKEPFCGALIGMNGFYYNRIFQLRPGEQVHVGADETMNEIVLHDLNAAACECVIGFDPDYQEYWIRPNYQKSVFLASHQPLGAERIYFLPRGTVIYIKNSNHVFELG